MPRLALLIASVASLVPLSAMAEEDPPVMAQQEVPSPSIRPESDLGDGMVLHFAPFDIAMHGYFRAPFAFSWRKSEGSTGGSGSQTAIHTPWLVDDDYFNSGFAYTRIQEHDWTELYLSVGNKYVSGTIGLMNSLFSDWARPLLDNQLGIAQGFLTLRYQFEPRRAKVRLQLKGGSFWDRFGWLESYDTYMFGRTHQLGVQGRLDVSLGKVDFWVLYGFGAHLEAIDLNQGLTLLNYVHAGVSYRRMFQFGFYYLDSLTRDVRQLKEITNADMNVVGLDVAVQTPYSGRLYLAASRVGADHAIYLAPAIEVVHGYGGRGITDNFLGTDKSEHGTGNLWNFAFEGSYSLRRLLGKVKPSAQRFLHGGDITLRYFGMVTYVESMQADPDPAINRDRRTYFKWGGELGWLALSWLGVSLRYDRVILNMDDDADSFRIVTPRLTFFSKWFLDAQIYLQYSHYFYGDRVTLRPGQVALETIPDKDVFKIQAQIVF